MGKRRTDYAAEAVEAARSVLLELARVLGEYREDIVVVGGWVPGLLLPQDPIPHIGSTDVDLALNHLKFRQEGYQTIEQLLLANGYQKSEKQRFVYFRLVSMNGRDYTVEVDLLSGEYGGRGKKHEHQRVQDVAPRKARGCDLAFERFTEVTIQATLPGGGIDKAVVRVASIVPFLVMKAMALSGRNKEKDAYDIYYCIYNYPGGLEALAAEFGPYVNHGLVKEALAKIAEKFATPDHVGPIHVVNFEGLTESEERQIVQQDACERVKALLEILGAL
ncbi:MAG TPA: hypothetical protein VFA07_01690 [Chthonomonadaceae bacterium]|nr:hypothetical protein [Chthonomonadaceae bacterium]